MRKRSVTIDGHRTSISLEDAFWAELSAIARARGLSFNALVAEIDHARGTPEGGNLSSALRLYVLAELEETPRLISVELEALAAHECAEIGPLRHRILPGLVLRPAIGRVLAEFVDDGAGCGVGLHSRAGWS